MNLLPAVLLDELIHVQRVRDTRAAHLAPSPPSSSPARAPSRVSRSRQLALAPPLMANTESITSPPREAHASSSKHKSAVVAAVLLLLSELNEDDLEVVRSAINERGL